MDQVEVRSLDVTDADWVAGVLAEHWQSSKIVSRGRVHDAARLPGHVAFMQTQRVGLVTYQIDGRECEIVSLNSFKERVGIGTSLIEAVRLVAISRRCRRLWLITTNDNLYALGFYQRRGFSIAALHRNAMDVSRKLKPEIPLIGLDKIPVRDELELEMLLNEA